MEYQIKTTNHFETWLAALKDKRAKAKKVYRQKTNPTPAPPLVFFMAV
ncbi:hypothetical protein [Neisseria musculi]|nr:hypothetical protein [Neisseria musculi]